MIYPVLVILFLMATYLASIFVTMGFIAKNEKYMVDFKMFNEKEIEQIRIITSVLGPLGLFILYSWYFLQPYKFKLESLLKSIKFEGVIIVGKAASGKTHFASELENYYNIEQKLSHTTRPPRQNEVDGVDYSFLTNDEFEENISLDIYAEHCNFNNWYYGTTKDELRKFKSFILTPSGIEQLKHTVEGHVKLSNSIILVFDIDEETRRLRLNKRGDVDSVERRINADNEDFEELYKVLEHYDYEIITDKNFKTKEIIQKHIASQLELIN